MEHDTYILEQAAEIVYSRPEQHGEPEDTFDEIAGAWSWYLGVDVSEIDAAIMFILMKIARSKNGHYDEDNPADVAGYAENWARLEEEKSTTPKCNECNSPVSKDELEDYECVSCGENPYPPIA